MSPNIKTKRLGVKIEHDIVGKFASEKYQLGVGGGGGVAMPCDVRGVWEWSVYCNDCLVWAHFFLQ
jgi:hypothetical protein